MDASGALKRSYTGPCDQIQYYDRGSDNYEFCFQLCNKGGGLMDDCQRLCSDYIKCTAGAKSVGAALDNVTTTSLSTEGIIAIVCACVLLAVIAGLGFFLYRRYTSRPNHELLRVGYKRGPGGDDGRIILDPLVQDRVRGTQPEDQDSSPGPRDETVILN